MPSYTLGLVAHVGAGKTALAEALLAVSGAKGGKGGGAGSSLDYLPEERQHKSTFKCALAHLSWSGCTVDLVDTPGSLSFIGDTVGALRAIDGAVMLSSAEPGLQSEAEFLWDRLQEGNLPRIIVINKMDREQADFPGRLRVLRETFGKHLVPVSMPWGQAARFHGVLDVMEACAYDYADPSHPKRTDIPADLTEAATLLRSQLLEAVAETDDTLLEKYLEAGTLPEEDARQGLMLATRVGKLVPVLCCAATAGIGVDRVLDAALRWLPACQPHSQGPPAAPASGAERSPFLGLVFKTQHDHYLGKLSLVRVLNGELHPGEDVLNPANGATERPAHLYKLVGREQREVQVIGAGELCALPKLAHTQTGQSLCSPKKRVALDPITFPQPVLTFALRFPAKGDEEKVSSALHRMVEMDPTLSFRHHTETGDFLVSGMGKMHLDVVLERLQREFQVEARYEVPHVPYRETVRAPAKAQGKYKKQSGGRGQYGDCWLELKPNGQAEALQFHSAIVGGVIPRNFIPAVEMGVAEAMHKGVLAGFPVIGIDATVYDGSYHDVDSSEMAFKIAGSMAFKKAMESAHPVLLEPVQELEIVIPGEYMGQILGDINGRRGRVLGSDNRGRKHVVRAEVPMAESLTYAIDLRSLTSGLGYFTQRFSRYDEVPAHLAERIVRERQPATKE